MRDTSYWLDATDQPAGRFVSFGVVFQADVWQLSSTGARAEKAARPMPTTATTRAATASRRVARPVESARDRSPVVRGEGPPGSGRGVLGFVTA